MPWCDTCDVFVEAELSENDSCQDCGSDLDLADKNSKLDKTPWHFWLIVGLLVMYLAWRLVIFVISLF